MDIQQKRNLNMYCIEIFTGDRRIDQMLVTVSVSLHGSDGYSSYKFPLTSYDHKTKVLFGKGKVDTFYMVADDIQDLRKIIFYCEGAPRPTWWLTHALVKVNGKVYKAEFNKWMGSSEEQVLTLIEDIRVPYKRGYIHLGPMLKLRGIKDEKIWDISVMIATENVPQLTGTVNFGTQYSNLLHHSYAPVLVYQQHNFQLWRWDLEVDLSEFGQKTCFYQLPQQNRVFSFKVPGINQKPGMLFCSCNDRSDPYSSTVGDHAHKSVGWNYMQQHMGESYHVLLMGGDQIYSDSLFTACETVRLWDNLPNKDKWEDSGKFFTQKTVEELNVFYFKMYIFCWSYYATQQVMASLPAVKMWDDHEIFDGWGSLDPAKNASAMYCSIFQVAKKHFFLFQMQGELSSILNERLADNENDWILPLPTIPGFGEPQQLTDIGPFNTGLTLTGDVSLLFFDLRTERRMRTWNEGVIMSENSFRNIEEWLKTKATLAKVQHLFVVMTVPINYPHNKGFNKLVDLVRYNLSDDLQDGHSDVAHEKERKRILEILGKFCATAQKGTRVTILSGDVHVGCFASAYYWPRNDKYGYVIEEYTSSGIAAQPPPPIVLAFLASPLFKKDDWLSTDDGSIITQKMIELPDGKLFFATSNFLCLTPTPASYKADWIGCPELAPEQATNPELPAQLPPPVVLHRVISQPYKKKKQTKFEKPHVAPSTLVQPTSIGSAAD